LETGIKKAKRVGKKGKVIGVERVGIDLFRGSPGPPKFIVETAKGGRLNGKRGGWHRLSTGATLGKGMVKQRELVSRNTQG